MIASRSVSFGVAAACVLLASCSGSDDAVGSSSGEPVTTTEAIITEPAEPFTTDGSVEESTPAEPDDEESVPESPESPEEPDEPGEPGDETVVVDAKDIVTRSPDAVDGGAQPQGLSTVTVRITSVAGDVCDVCMWLADSGSERSTGLMGVTDLGGPVGMAFSWSAPTDGRFFMLGTPTPLSIAWFAESGDHVGQSDMSPCLTDDSSTCERYGADAPYDLAIEMFEGQLGAVGIAPGASVEVVEGSESPECLLDA